MGFEVFKYILLAITSRKVIRVGSVFANHARNNSIWSSVNVCYKLYVHIEYLTYNCNHSWSDKVRQSLTQGFIIKALRYKYLIIFIKFSTPKV